MYLDWVTVDTSFQKSATMCMKFTSLCEVEVTKEGSLPLPGLAGVSLLARDGRGEPAENLPELQPQPVACEGEGT